MKIKNIFLGLKDQLLLIRLIKNIFKGHVLVFLIKDPILEILEILK